MRTTRWLFGVSGVLLALFGVYRLLTEIHADNLRVLAIWLVAALLLHDGVVAPVTAAVGFVIGRVVPHRLRRYVQGALVTGAAVTVIALPLIYRQGRPAQAKALLQQDYATNLGVLLGVVAAGAAALYVGRVLRDHRASATNVRPAERHTSSNP